MDPLEHNQHQLFLSPESLSTEQVAAFRASLPGNNQLKEVYFRNFASNTTSLLEDLLWALPTQSLDGIFLHCCSGVPVGALTQVLTWSRNLTALSLRYCSLSATTTIRMNADGQEEAWRALETALKEHPALAEVCLESCEFDQVMTAPLFDRNGITAALPNMDSLMQALAAIPTLKHMEYVRSALSATATSLQQRLSQDSLRAIGSVPELALLKLRNVNLSQEEVVVLCDALMKQHDNSDNSNDNHHHHHQQQERRSSLDTLMLSCDLGNTSATALSHLLERPSSVGIRQFSLRVDHLEDTDCPKLLAQALQYPKKQNANGNQLLKSFQLSGSAAANMSQTAKDAFFAMVQSNVHLDHVSVDTYDADLSDSIAFYLQLNHKGRRDLFGNSSHGSTTTSSDKQHHCQTTQREEDLWIQALCQNNTDVRALHYFIASHPALFANVALTNMATTATFQQ
mgnify:CR=1 FL=1